MVWHSKNYIEVSEHFGTDPQKGLSTEQIDGMREKYGSNSIITVKPKSVWRQLFDNFNEPVIYILVAAAIINAFIGAMKDTIVIAIVVVLNTLIGFFQERRSENALKALKKMAAPNARVIRDGEQKQIPTTEVVCGDILVLESGMRLAADARLIDTQKLMVDESMLTGESFAVEKKFDVEIDEKAPLGDRLTMVYSGTIIQKGRGLGIVTAVGPHTEFGKISVQVAQAEETVSPLQMKMARFSKGLSIAIMIAIIAIFILGFLRGNDWITMFLTSVGLAVSAIPEGLPVAVTITLSIGVAQMARRKAVVKRLAAVETLGSTNVICTDKTGTLTKNQMIVTNIFCGMKDYNVNGTGYGIEGNVIDKATGKTVTIEDHKTLYYLSLVAGLCTESKITKDDEEWDITGDPTEAALMIASDKLYFKPDNFDVSVDIPFESENQLMAVKASRNDEVYTLAKGAPEKIIGRSRAMLDCDGNEIPMDKESLKNKFAEYSKRGLRVLAMAIKKNSAPEEKLNFDDLDDMLLIGFAGIEDSIRPEVVKAVYECHNAGINVKMITGDHAKTAQAVAAAVGIGEGKAEPVAVDGQELDEMSDEELFNRADEIDVYARVAPQHKFRIVQQLQKNQKVVSMTGDGVNDAPALKQADIGVAMGSGTDVAKESAHIILMDDNFATIVKAVRRGRVVLHNLRHIILYILATSLGGILTISMSVIIGFPLPVLPAQLLWINLVTDGTSTFPLAFEKEHGDVMYFPPNNRDAPLVDREMIYRIIFAGVIMMLGTLTIFYLSAPDIFAAKGQTLTYAQTMAFCTLAFFQIWNVQNSRSLDRSIFFRIPHPGIIGKPHPSGQHLDRVSPSKNPILLAVMLLAIGLQVAAVELPVMNRLLNTVNLSLHDWLVVIGVSFSIIVIVEIAKFLTAVSLFMRKKYKIPQ